MRLSRALGVFTLAALCVSAQLPSPTGQVTAAEEVVVRVATVAPEGTPWEAQLRAFKAYIEKASGGRFKVKMFMGGSLGGEKALVRRAASGSLEVFGGSVGALGSIVQELNVVEAPYLFDSYEQADRALDGPAKPIVERVIGRDGFVFGHWSENGFRSWFTKDKPVHMPADLAGLRMRSQESAVHLDTYKALGATPVPIDITNVLTSLQTGVVDGFDNTPLYAFAASWYRASKHLVLSKHCYQPGVVVYSKRWFEALPPDLQEVLRNVPPSVQSEGRSGVRSMDSILVDNLKRYGVRVHEPTAEQRAAFKKATAAVAPKFVKATGKDAKDLYDAIVQSR